MRTYTRNNPDDPQFAGMQEWFRWQSGDVVFWKSLRNTFLFVRYFKDLPRELIEASRVEGASWWQICIREVMPLSGPVLATAAILKFLVMYSQYLWPLIVVQQESCRPVMVGLQYFFQLNTAWGEIMACLTVITLPVLAFYLVLQRASIASTGVKG